MTTTTTAAQSIITDAVESAQSYETVTPEEAKELIDTTPDLVIVDLGRSYDEGHIPGALNGDELVEVGVGFPSSLIDQDKTYLAYESTPIGSELTCAQIASEGCTVFRMKGYLTDWIDAGYPFETTSSEAMASTKGVPQHLERFSPGRWRAPGLYPLVDRVWRGLDSGEYHRGGTVRRAPVSGQWNVEEPPWRVLGPRWGLPGPPSVLSRRQPCSPLGGPWLLLGTTTPSWSCDCSPSSTIGTIAGGRMRRRAAARLPHDYAWSRKNAAVDDCIRVSAYQGPYAAFCRRNLLPTYLCHTRPTAGHQRKSGDRDTGPLVGGIYYGCLPACTSINATRGRECRRHGAFRLLMFAECVQIRPTGPRETNASKSAALRCRQFICAWQDSNLRPLVS